MLRATLFAVLLTFSFQSSALAKLTREECSDVDYTEEMGPADELTGFGWCYAHAAGDLLSFKLKQKVSAPAIAMSRSLIHFGEKTIEDSSGGLVGFAIDRALNDGICFEKNFPYQGDRLVKLYKKNPKQFMNKMNHACGQRVYPEGISSSSLFGFGRIERASRVLLSGRILAAYIRNDVFYEGRSLPLIPNHVSTIIGQRWNSAKNTCEFKVRNAYGVDSCKHHSPRLECKNGNLWLSEKDLKRSVTQFVYLDH